ncbi:hypothetical protein [Maribacter sp. ACAM166]|uniref:hypothetical protein n=1 Tax=Maribacter sp. ACAM166 TaxID=2508996 RepID=UPI0010FE113E|nr:hypothetical protein [Maribacter sp. ACAM166]TLP80904.1 hypothetical protein ES765_05505 [Maribacter sp. ACAM166]
MEKAIHTDILESKRIDSITVVRENPDNYPKGKSNIYAKDIDNNVIWSAELPLIGDTYCNPIQWNKGINKDAISWDDFFSESNNSFVVSSWNCFTVSIDYKNGKIIHKELTK